jgi:hypothetical protein
MNKPRPYLPLVTYDAETPKVRIGSLMGFPNAVVEHPLPQLFGNGHVAVYGGTGMGKSKWTEGILRQLMTSPNAPGGVVFDPHGDLVENLLTFIDQCPGELPVGFMDNFEYIELAGDKTFSFDPFDPLYYQDLHPRRRRRWVAAQAWRTAIGIIRMKGEYSFKNMPTLERYMVTLLTAAGTPLDERGTHLPLCDIHILYQPKHKDHDELYDLIAPRLSDKVLANWDEIRKVANDKHSDDLRSTINRFDAFLDEIVAPIFSCSRPSLDLPKLIKNRGWLLVNLAEPTDATEGQANAVGSILLRGIIDQVKSKTDAADRKDFVLWIDEASNYVGPDVLKVLRQQRKHRLSCCLCVQDLEALDTDEVKMSGAVKKLCKAQATFQQKSEYDLERLESIFALPNYKLELLLHYSNVQTGYVNEVLREIHSGTVVSDAETEGSVDATERKSLVSEGNALSEIVCRRVGTHHSENETDIEEDFWADEEAKSLLNEIASHQGHSSRRGVAKSHDQELSSRFGKSLDITNEHSIANASGIEQQHTDASEQSERIGHRSGNKIGEKQSRQTSSEMHEDRSRTAISDASHQSRRTKISGPHQGSDKSATSERQSGQSDQSESREGTSSAVASANDDYREQSEDVTSEQAAARKASDSLAVHKNVTKTDARRVSAGDSQEIAATVRDGTSLSEETEENRGVTAKTAAGHTLSHKRGSKIGKQRGRGVEQSDEQSLSVTEQRDRRLGKQDAVSQQSIRQTQLTTARTVGETEREHSLPVNPIVAQPTGGLVANKEVQQLQIFQRLRTLDEAVFLYSFHNYPTMIVHADEVGDIKPFANAIQRSERICRIKAAIWSHRSSIFEPEWSLADQQRRRDEWFNSLQQFTIEAHQAELLRLPKIESPQPPSSQSEAGPSFEF